MSKVSKGFFWSAVDQFSVQGIHFVLSIIIARLVSPSAYGVVVMVQVFMAFAQLFIDGGFKSALIQKKDRKDEDYYTVFIFNMIIAIFLYAVMFVSAPYIAVFYNEPQLTDLTRVISLNLILSSLSLTQMVKIQVDLNFKVLAKARIISVIVSGVIGVYCAYIGMEAWALVIQGVLSTLISSVLLIFFSKWIPRLVFSRESFKKLFGFGSKILFTNFLTTFYIQITNMVIGKFYSPAQLAFYNRGFTLSQLPSVNIMELMGRTIYPIYCELQEDKKSLDIAYRKYLRLSVLAIFPILIFVGALSEPLIEGLLTAKWLPAAPLLTIFCVSFLAYPFLYNSGNCVLALGHSDLMAKAALLKRAIAFSLLFASLFINVTAVAIAITLSNFIEVFINMLCVRKVMGVSLLQQISMVKDLLFISLASCLMASVVQFFIINIWMQLIIGGLFAFGVFVICIFLFNIEEKQMLVFYYNKIIKGNGR